MGSDLFKDVYGSGDASNTEPTPSKQDSGAKGSLFQDVYGGKGEAPMVDYDPSKITGAGLMGAVTGFATPELAYGLGKGLSAIPYPPVKMAGTALQAAAPFMGFGERAAGATLGGLSAAGGEAAKETAILKGIDPKYANLIGIGVETISPALIPGAMKAFKSLPGIRNVGDVFTYVAKQVGRDPSSFTDAERRFIALEADKMRGSQPGAGPLYKELEAGAQQIETQATADAAARQQRAQQDALNKLVESGKQPRLADRITTTAQSKVHNIGNADADLTTIGQSQRKAIVDRFNTENLERDATYKAKKAERDAIVNAKEQSGDVLENMPEYKNAIDELKSKLLIGEKAMEQKVAPVTESGVKSAYQRIYEAMIGNKVSVNPEEAEALAQKGVQIVDGIDNVTQKPGKYAYFPTSFDALDHVRRKLGDVAYGIEQEGYDALGQGIAKNWYKKLSDLQSKYAGPIQDELQSGYEITSGLLERFKGGPGAAVLKTEKLAPDMFSLDPKDVPARFFGSKSGVADLAALTKNPALVEKTASDYVASNLKDKTIDQAKSWVAKQEFLNAPELAKLRPKINAYLKDLEAATTRAEGVRSVGKAQETEAARIQAAGEVEAKGISEEGRRRAQLILGDKDPEARVAEILGSKSKKLWDEVSGVIIKTPNGKELLDRAVAQHVADLAVRAERGMTAVDALSDLREPLTTRGLMTPERVDSLMAQLQKMRAPEKQKLSWLSNQFLRGGATVLGAQVGSFLGGLAPNYLGGQ